MSDPFLCGKLTSHVCFVASFRSQSAFLKIFPREKITNPEIIFWYKNVEEWRTFFRLCRLMSLDRDNTEKSGLTTSAGWECTLGHAQELQQFFHTFSSIPETFLFRLSTRWLKTKSTQMENNFAVIKKEPAGFEINLTIALVSLRKISSISVRSKSFLVSDVGD